MSDAEEDKLSRRLLLEVLLQQYQLERQVVDQIYTRGGLLLTALTALAAATYALVKIQLLPLVFVRIDVFIYFVGVVGTVSLLGIAGYWLAACFVPRVNYRQLASGTKLLTLVSERNRQSPKD